MPDKPSKQGSKQGSDQGRRQSGYGEWERKEAERKARESEENQKGEERHAGSRDSDQE